MKFLIKIFSPSFLLISILLLLYIFYKSEIYWNGEMRDYYFIYYFLLFLLTFLSIITFFINQKIKEYLIILGISLVFTLYAFEIFLNYKDIYSKEHLLKERIYEKKTGKKWDRRTSLKIYKDLKKINSDLVIGFTPNQYKKENNTIFPLSSISNSETLFCNENGYYAIYQSDRYGFNNPDEEWNKNEIEYLLVGDSFTHGSCVNRPNDIASVLRTLSNKSVLNLGSGGNGPLMEYAVLREYLNQKVKKVFWFYFEGNDLKNLEFEKRNRILTNYLDNLNFTQNLKFRQNEINILTIKSIEDVRKKKFKKKLMYFIKLRNLRTSIISIFGALPFEPSIENVVQPEFKEILELTKNLTIKNNSKLYFIYLPEYNRYKVKYDNTNYNLVKNIVEYLNIPFIDVHKELFENEPNPLQLFPFELLGHYNVEGYKKVAETIFKLTKD